MSDELTPTGYAALLADLKTRIGAARVRAALAVNRELIELYWHIGREILERQETEGWGTKVVERLSRDLREAFPEVRGLSRTNLLYMRAFAETWGDDPNVPQPVGQIPWGHNRVLIDKLDDHETRLWYAARTIEQGWSRDTLIRQIKNQMHARQGAALTNYADTLPKPQSDLAQELVKSEYNFDFLGIGAEAHERQVEQGLIDHIRRFLLELGAGFAFVGNQYHLNVGGEDFYVDLLFYHVKLHCYVVIELKATAFKPEYAGKMNFYLTAVDELVRDAEHDQPTVGILLCRERNKIVAEYALRDIKKPLGVSTYLTEELPQLLAESLPSTDEIEAELEADIDMSVEPD